MGDFLAEHTGVIVAVGAVFAAIVSALTIVALITRGVVNITFWIEQIFSRKRNPLILIPTAAEIPKYSVKTRAPEDPVEKAFYTPSPVYTLALKNAQSRVLVSLAVFSMAFLILAARLVYVSLFFTPTGDPALPIAP